MGSKEGTLVGDVCPQSQELAAYIDRGLSATKRSEIESHLLHCRRCREVIAFVLESQSAVPDPTPRSSQ